MRLRFCRFSSRFGVMSALTQSGLPWHRKTPEVSPLWFEIPAYCLAFMQRAYLVILACPFISIKQALNFSLREKRAPRAGHFIRFLHGGFSSMTAF